MPHSDAVTVMCGTCGIQVTLATKLLYNYGTGSTLSHCAALRSAPIRPMSRLGGAPLCGLFLMTCGSNGDARGMWDSSCARHFSIL
eukprot:286757-Chlamydomonas_euryale.AAC.4